MTRSNGNRRDGWSGCARVVGLEGLESRRMLSAGVVLGSGGTLVVNTGKGWDVVTVARSGKTALIVTINGQKSSFAAADVKRLKISTFRGNDTITIGSPGQPVSVPAVVLAGEGNDAIMSGHGADSLCGQEGNDRIYGQGGNDTIKGGTGDDTLMGGGNNDKVFGEAGNDACLGGTDDDLVDGGAGNDELHDGFGKDTVYGRAGDDHFWVFEGRKEFRDAGRTEWQFTDPDGYGKWID